jgi:hypothetical protein
MDAKFTPGPWIYEPGGGHAPNSIRGSESVQVNGWLERRNGISNASYSDRVCENLGDTSLPGPAANARLIAAAPELLEALEFFLYCVKDGKAFMHRTGDAFAVEAIARARAAIAKAEGA